MPWYQPWYQRCSISRKTRREERQSDVPRGDRSYLPDSGRRIPKTMRRVTEHRGSRQDLAFVSQKTRKFLGSGNGPVKPQQNLSSVSQSAQKISSPRNTSFFPINFTGSHYLPKSVFGFLFSYAINKMASADTLFSLK